MGGGDTLIPTHRMYGIRFGLYSSEEILQLSVKEITNPQSLDALLHPTYGGLYDPALGAVEINDVCSTCGQASAMCPGHFGHIKLPLPVYNPVLFGTLVQILKGSCFECHRLLVKQGMQYVLQKQMDLLELGLLSEVEQLIDVYNEVISDYGKDEGTFDVVKERIDAAIHKLLQDNPESDSHITKNVTYQRQSLVKDFLGGKYFSGAYCPHCKMPQRKLKAEHHSKIYASQGLTRSKATKLIVHRQMQIKKRLNQGEEEESPELEVEMEQENTEKMEKQLLSLMQQSYLTPSKVKSHLGDLWDNEQELLRCILGSLRLQSSKVEKPVDLFFLDVLPIPPTRFRPMNVRQGKKFDNPQSTNMSKVLTDSGLIRELLQEMKNKGKELSTSEPAPTDKKTVSDVEKLQNIWQQMQVHVNCVIDSDLDKLNQDKTGGIKQIIEKKEGLFRQNMMGKRVNFAARSVISPDPYINTNEIGIPDVFARKLTYPEPVTPWNFAELKQAVINGPDIHPGAWYVILENGHRVVLPRHDKTQREAYAKQLLTPGAHTSGNAPNKKVLRHLKNGDVLLLNRQPTLHKPSVQAHKARILPGEKTLRLHYANCKAYNADFDGDEMNAHFPQNELGRAEAYTIAATDFQYLVPKDGTPLAGLIQDHMIGGVHLMTRGRFFNRMDYQQLVYDALTDSKGPVRLLPPAMIKPQVLWSGKQVLSTVILNILPSSKPAVNLEGKAKVSSKNWLNGKVRSWQAGGTPLTEDAMSESEVVIRQGELLVGVLDKAHYGNTPYGLIHCCYELYGGQIAGLLLTAFAKLFTKVLQFIGFTLGVADILCMPQADKKRRKIMEKGKKTGPQVAARALRVKDYQDGLALKKRMQEAHTNVAAGELKDLDLAMKGNTDEIQNDIVKALMPWGLEKKFPHNNLQLMVQAGAKGSSVNCMQISCLLGQIELEGRRPPLMLSGRFLPAFVPYDPSPRAGGFVDGRFLTGIRPQEYFFHCMAGREGLVDTAVKTSRSGYLQRCIIKHLEGLTVNYDLTVRDADGSIVQFEYGEDSLDVPKTQFLKPSQFPFLIQNKDAVMTSCQKQELLGRVQEKPAQKAWKKIKKWKRKHKHADRRRSSGFLNYCRKQGDRVTMETEHVMPGRMRTACAMCDSWRGFSTDTKAKFEKHKNSCPEPVVTCLPRHTHLSAVSEKLEVIIENYIKDNPHKLLDNGGGGGKSTSQMSGEEFKQLINMRSLQALVHPGEAVGLLAAQSIGEPSTQMTLNTFHFAGRGEMNVTLGIPRLREILLIASETIGTPAMDVPLLDTSHARKTAPSLKKKLTRVYLSEVLEKVTVSEYLTVKERGNKGRLYKVRFSFLPPEVYSEELSINPHQILRFMELKFFKQFQEVIKKKMNELINSSLFSSGRIKSSIPETEKRVESKGEENEDVEDDDQNDNDATSVRQRERQMEEKDYEGEEEERGQVVGSDQDTDNEEDAETADSHQTPEESEEDEPRPGTPQTPELTERSRPSLNAGRMDSKRVTNVLSSASMAVKYEYDAVDDLWAEITLKVNLGEHKLDMTSFIESEAKKTVVYTVPKITRAFLSESKKPGEEGTHLKTEGVNIQEMYGYDKVLDLNRLYTNDIHAFAKTYGIEAACRVLIKEIKDVFAAYGIQIDPHHLSLIADYMTFEGVYKAFNRYGIESNASPLQKMTFETSMGFLKKAMLQGDKDDLTSPSSRLVVGRLVGGGTGCFDLLQPLR